MASDKKEYQAVLTALLDQSTVTALINKLNKVVVATEDMTLRKGLWQVLQVLNQAATLQTKKSSVGAVRLDDPRYKPLADYCQISINSIKPQWQVIAEQHGWGPKSAA